MSLDKNSISTVGRVAALTLTLVVAATSATATPFSVNSKASSDVKGDSGNVEPTGSQAEALAAKIEAAVKKALESTDLKDSKAVEKATAEAIASVVQGQPASVVQAAMTIAAPAIINSVQTIVAAAGGPTVNVAATVKTVTQAVQATITQVNTVVAAQAAAAPAATVVTTNFTPPAVTTSNPPTYVR